MLLPRPVHSPLQALLGGADEDQDGRFIALSDLCLKPDTGEEVEELLELLNCLRLFWAGES